MQNTDSKTGVKPKAVIVVDLTPEDETMRVGADFDGDGQADIQARITIEDKRVWAIIGLIVIIVAGAKAVGLW